MPGIRALLVDDHALFRESVAKLLAAEAGFEVRHCARIGDAVTLLAEFPADVVLLDHDLGGERAFEFLPAARQVGFTGPVLIVTAWIGEHEARRLLNQGVCGIFPKEASIGDLVEGIRAIRRGERYIHPRYAHLWDSGSSPEHGGPKFDERQRMVLRFVTEGLSNKEIAWRLQISESYVKAILQRLFQKTGVRTRGQLVRVALEQYADQLRTR